MAIITHSHIRRRDIRFVDLADQERPKNLSTLFVILWHMVATTYRNWNFSDITYKDTQYLTHCFHPYPAKFIPQIPRRLIELYAPKKGDKILDPFCGSGTTLVEAKLTGRPSLGIDANPLAIMISRSKVSPIKKKQLERFILWLENCRKKELKILHPQETNLSDDRSWFREDVLGQIYLILENSREIQDSNTRNFVNVALSSILKGVSNARMDRIVPTLPKKPAYADHKHYDRIVDNEKRNINVFARLSSRLRLMQSRLELFLSTASNAKAVPYLGDARKLERVNLDFLRKGEVKLVITSPPYWSAFDYEKIHQLSINVLNLKRTSFEAEISRKNFLIEMEEVYEQISKCLTKGGAFCLVIGRSKKKINRKLADMGREYDMQLRERFVRRIKNHSFFVKGIKSEEILVFRKR